MGYKVGRQTKLYLDPAGAGAGTYTELAVSKNPTFDPAWDEAAVEDHASNIKRALKGLMDVPIEIEANLKTDDAMLLALRTAFLDPDDGQVGVAFCTGDMTDAAEWLFEADCEVLSFRTGQVINETVTVTASLKPAANSDFEPTFSITAAA